jgi:hypothetical protein
MHAGDACCLYQSWSGVQEVCSERGVDWGVDVRGIRLLLNNDILRLTGHRLCGQRLLLFWTNHLSWQETDEGGWGPGQGGHEGHGGVVCLPADRACGVENTMSTPCMCLASQHHLLLPAVATVTSMPSVLRLQERGHDPALIVSPQA